MRQFVCPACAAVNRAPETRDAAQAKCGRCGRKVFEGKPVEVTAGQLAAHRRSTQGTAVLLDVWAPWCGPCQAMAPHYAAAAARLEPDVRLLKLNSDAEPQAAAELNVRGIPALFLFKDGKLLAQQSGLMNADQIVAWTKAALAGAAA